jgi:hypothetical protein
MLTELVEDVSKRPQDQFAAFEAGVLTNNEINMKEKR